MSPPALLRQLRAILAIVLLRADLDRDRLAIVHVAAGNATVAHWGFCLSVERRDLLSSYPDSYSASTRGLDQLADAATVLSSDQVRHLVARLYAAVMADPQVTLRLGSEARNIETEGEDRGFTVGVAPTGANDPARRIHARRVVVAVGRRGQRWWRKQVCRLGLASATPTPSVGLRFECPRPMLASGAAIHPDFKTTLTVGGVKLKTFCFCAGPGGGRIKFTDYGDHTLLDGHIVVEPEGEVANFALLAQLRDADALPRSAEWIERYLLAPYRALRIDQPGKPVLQWYPDFRARMLTCRTLAQFRQWAGFEPSLSAYQMADLASLLPGDIHDGFCSVFERLMSFFAPLGRFDPRTDGARVGVIGLELESLWDELSVTPSMETSLRGLHACGDCAGIAQGILQAAVSGIAAADSIAASLSTPEVGPVGSGQ